MSVHACRTWCCSPNGVAHNATVEAGSAHAISSLTGILPIQDGNQRANKENQLAVERSGLERAPVPSERRVAPVGGQMMDTHSAPLLSSHSAVFSDGGALEESEGTVKVSRLWLEGFLAQLSHKPYPGPGDVAQPTGSPDDELCVHTSDLKVAGTRLPGNHPARNRLVKELIGKHRQQDVYLSTLLTTAVDPSGWYTDMIVGNALERHHQQQMGHVRPGSPTEAEAATARALLADTLTGRVQAATVIQRAYRSYIRRKRLSRWFRSHESMSFQRSHLSDRVWKQMAMRSKTITMYRIDERTFELPKSPPEEEEEEEEEQEEQASQPITPALVMKQFRRPRARAFGSTYESHREEAHDVGGPGPFMRNRSAGATRQASAEKIRPPPSACRSILNQLGSKSMGVRRQLWVDGQDDSHTASDGSLFTTPFGSNCAGSTRPASPTTASGHTTPLRWNSGDLDGEHRWEATSGSFLPPIQSSSAMSRIMKLRHAMPRQSYSMSGVDTLGARLRPLSSTLTSPGKSSQSGGEGGSQAGPGGLDASPSRYSLNGHHGAPRPPSSPGRHDSGAGSLLVQWHGPEPSQGPADLAAVRSACAQVAAAAAATGGSPAPGRRLLEPLDRAAPRGSVIKPDDVQSGRRGGHAMDAAPTSGTAIVMHGTVTPRKPSRMSTQTGGETPNGKQWPKPTPPGMPGAPAGMGAGQDAAGLNPKVLFLKWKEEERKRKESGELGEDGVAETFVSYMQRTMMSKSAKASG